MIPNPTMWMLETHVCTSQLRLHVIPGPEAFLRLIQGSCVSIAVVVSLPRYNVVSMWVPNPPAAQVCVT